MFILQPSRDKGTSPSVALGSSPPVELPFAVVAPQNFRDAPLPILAGMRIITRCHLRT